MWLYVGVILAAVLYYYYYVWIPKEYFRKQGIAYKASLPALVFLAWTTITQKTFAQIFLRLYEGKEKVVGTFAFDKPSLIIRDPELIKTIGIKDFDHFVDHSDIFFKEEVDSLFGKNLFALKGKRWKNMRSTLSPSFTGSKMRGMFEFMSECGEQFAKHYLGQHVAQGNGKPYEVELRDLYTRFTNDVIASTAFGIKIDSFKDSDNLFFKMGREATAFKFWRLLLVNSFPKLSQFVGLGILPRAIDDFFRKLVKETMDTREKQHIIRPDMIHLLMESRKGRLHHEDSHHETDSGFAVIEESNVGKSNQKLDLTDEDITAQALIFFVAGFETVSITMCFGAYELTVNPDLQRRLQEEIDETLSECNGKLTYNALLKMQYLDQVVTETLRKWPSVFQIDRNCTQPYTLVVDDKEIHIKPGMRVVFPIFGIHRDPKYYPNPDKFDPERFSEENKDKLTPFTFLPFGIGPRACIGSRFALMESKLALFHLLANFNIVPSPKSHIPLVIKGNSTNLRAKHDLWFGLEPRKKT